MKGDKYQDDRSFTGSVMSAGVESGLSHFEPLKRGSTHPNETTMGDGTGSTSRQKCEDTPAGSKAGKNFTFRY